MAASKKKALVLLAEGAEEMEVSILVDVLRRGVVDVVLAGVAGDAAVTCSRGLRMLPDLALESLSTDDSKGFHAIVMPGGAGGAAALAADVRVGELLRGQEERGALLAAICAAPLALVAHGVGRGKQMTSHPSVAAEVGEHGSWLDAAVVLDQNLMTSQGPGTSFEFALALVAELQGEEQAEALRGPMILD